MAHTRTLEEMKIVSKFINDLKKKDSEVKDNIGGIYYRYKDEVEDGVWIDPETGFIASFMNCKDDPNDCYSVINWNLNHEPEGGEGENCVG